MGDTNMMTTIYILLALLILFTFIYRIRKLIFRKYIYAQAAMIISFILVSLAMGGVSLWIRLAALLVIIVVFMYGRRSSN